MQFMFYLMRLFTALDNPRKNLGSRQRQQIKWQKLLSAFVNAKIYAGLEIAALRKTFRGAKHLVSFTDLHNKPHSYW